MSELRRPTLPDRPDPVDRPAERDGRPQPVDQPAFQPIDYRKTIRAQKDFVRETPAQPPEARKPPASLDWMTGRPPPGLEPRTLERTEPPNQAERFSELTTHRGRGIRAEVTKRAEAFTQTVDHTADTVGKLWDLRSPGGQALTRTQDYSAHVTPQHGTIDVGAGTAALFAGGLAIFELTRKMHTKFQEWKDRRGDNR